MVDLIKEGSPEMEKLKKAVKEGEEVDAIIRWVVITGVVVFGFLIIRFLIG